MPERSLREIMLGAQIAQAKRKGYRFAEQRYYPERDLTPLGNSHQEQENSNHERNTGTRRDN